jgi:glycosyltransferase involved in cell wall biosynthesis
VSNATTPNAPSAGLPAGTRIAVVVDWLAQFGGAELVIKEILAAYPGADLFALFDVMAPEARRRLSDRPARTSFMQHIPGIGARYRSLLPLMPTAVRSLAVRDYDLVISSHHAVAKGVRTTSRQVHVCYCHSPTRYLWDKRDEYLDDHAIVGFKRALAVPLLDRLQKADFRAALGVHQFLVNSRYVADRVRRNYHRESVVVPPPVDTAFFTPGGEREATLYVTASRQVPYKRIDRIIDAFRSLPDRRLVVIGDGPQHAKLTAIAAGAPNIQLLGEVPREEVRGWFRRARAFVFAADEDFGIVPLEAQACGTPVIALGKGGALETVIGTSDASRTGHFFADDAPESIAAAVRQFEAFAHPPSSAACRTNAERFTAEHFRAGLTSAVQAAWSATKAASREQQ